MLAAGHAAFAERISSLVFGGLAYSHRAPHTAACQSTSTTECAMGAVASRLEMGYPRGDAKLTQSGVGGVGKTTA